MANESLLQIVIRLKNEATNEIKAVNDEIKNLKDNSQKDFKAISGEFQKFGTGITAVGVGLTGLLVKTGLTAARVEVLGTVMENVGRVSNISTDVLYEQEEVIKKLGITTRASRELLVRFMQSQLDVADASKIARVAQDLAVISGQNSSEAAETLTQAIVSQRPMLLRQFGIVQNLNDIYGKQAEVLGKTAEELTEVDKKQALLNTILEEGAKVAGTYEAAMGDVGKQISSLPRLTEEAEVAFGEAFLPVMEWGVKVLSDMLKAYQALSPETKKFITIVVMLGAALALIVGPILLLLGFLPAMAAGFTILLGPVGAVIAAITALTIIVGVLVAKWGVIKQFFVETWEGIKIIFQEAIDYIMRKLEPLLNIIDTVKSGINTLKSKIPEINLPKITLPSWSVPDWLKFQDGGVVPGRTGQPVPILAHAGETVIPVGKEIGNTFNFDFSNAFIGDIEKFQREIIDTINRAAELKSVAGQ